MHLCKPYGLTNLRLINIGFIDMEAPYEEGKLINPSYHSIIKNPNGSVNLKICPPFGNKKSKAPSLASCIGKVMCVRKANGLKQTTSLNNISKVYLPCASGITALLENQSGGSSGKLSSTSVTKQVLLYHFISVIWWWIEMIQTNWYSRDWTIINFKGDHMVQKYSVWNNLSRFRPIKLDCCPGLR